MASASKMTLEERLHIEGITGEEFNKVFSKDRGWKVFVEPAEVCAQQPTASAIWVQVAVPTYWGWDYKEDVTDEFARTRARNAVLDVFDEMALVVDSIREELANESQV